MNFLDVIIGVPLAYSAWIGFKKGFIIEVFTLLALFVGLYAGIHFSELISEKLKKSFEIESRFLPTISFTLIFLGIGAMVYFAGKALEKVIKLALLSPLNKIGGVLFALLKGSYIVSIVLILLNSYDKENKFIPLKTKDESYLYKPVLKLSTSTLPNLKNSSFFSNDTLSSSNLSIKQLLRAKEIADSLGVKTSDVIELTKIYSKYENKN